MDRVIFEQVCAMPTPHTVSERTITERWAFTSLKAVWPPLTYTSGLFHQGGSTAGRRHSNILNNHRRQLHQDTISQPAAHQTLLWERQSHGTYTYGLVIFIGPHRQYHIHTARGKMLVQNRHFLHRHVPGSIPPGQMENEAPQPVQI